MKAPHSLTPDGMQYIDESSGITIRYSRIGKSVEAIAFYKKTDRAPAKIHK